MQKVADKASLRQEGFGLLCADYGKNVSLWQKGSEFAVLHYEKGTEVTQFIKGKTQDEGFEKAEKVYNEWKLSN